MFRLIWTTPTNPTASGWGTGKETSNTWATRPISALTVLTLIMVICALKAPATFAAETGIADERAAVATALSALGLDDMQHRDLVSKACAAAVETLADSTTPFLPGRFAGRRVWRIAIQQELSLNALIGNDIRDQEPRHTFQVYIDSATGIVLKIEGRGSHHDSTVIRRLSAADAEDYLTRAGRAVQLRLPTSEPEVSLLDALMQASVNVSDAMEMSAVYAMHPPLHNMADSTRSSQERAVWIVDMWGGIHFPPGKWYDLPIYQRNHYKMIVDADTGEYLRGTNEPMPPKDDSEDE